MADFQQHLSELQDLGARVVALSADSEADTGALAARLGIEFSLAFGLEPAAVARVIACYTGVREGRPLVQPTPFILHPDGTIAHAVYSSGKVGRLTATDALTVLKDAQKKAAKAST